MDQHQGLWDFMHQQSAKLLQQTIQHIGLTFISLLIAILIGVPLGIFISRNKKAAGIVLGTAGVLQTIPSIALLGFLIPVLGIGPIPAIAALFLYALLPVIRNTYTGIDGVDPGVKEAALAMGMTATQRLFRVDLVLAFPVIMAGIRTATVINVGVGTLAAYIAAGGLGEFIFGGIALNNTNMILAGAIPAALLAILLDFLLSLVQRTGRRRRRTVLACLPLGLLLLSSFYVLPIGNSRLLAGFTPEFMGRRDGDIGLREVYGLKVRTVVISDAVMYKAIYDHKLDIISGYSTDGRLKAYDLVTLEDDRSIFPPYYAAPVIRNRVLKQYPELAPVLNKLSGRINDSIMTLLNYRAEYLNQPPDRIARDFLQAQGLYQPPRNGHKGIVRLGSKIFPEQYILTDMYAMLVRGYTDLDVESKTGLGGTKICFEALTHDQIDMYPEYTGTALLAILQPPAALTARLTPDRDSVYRYVAGRFSKDYDLTWLEPIGFNNAYALMMRRSQSQQLGIHTITDLTNYLKK
ncbi:MAG TPA: ABC transporter permease/substrate-binding protein [Puia sp.]|uniref:ABC transporter permease/substrate-binding protein n=1 Tax=Puia sp. TaxID=2045100 RepID=UPI002BB0DFAD|nr:ABC transporter permease/substrate-binding protein [Puia sp.]HVU99143.1 ABC transporter permease/substrate-binding protein [Puia sp.]